MTLGDLVAKLAIASNAGSKTDTHLNHIRLFPSFLTERLVATNKIPGHTQYPLGSVYTEECRVIESHHVADLNSFAVAVQSRDQEPVAPRVEGRIHRRALAELYGRDVLPEQSDGAEQAGAIEGIPGNSARLDRQR